MAAETSRNCSSLTTTRKDSMVIGISSRQNIGPDSRRASVRRARRPPSSASAQPSDVAAVLLTIVISGVGKIAMAF